jgi:uncharacterized SAM-binding protein YcdF (DUF218 family)
MTPQAIAKFLADPLILAFIILLLILVRRQVSRKAILLFTLYLYLVSIPLTGKLIAQLWYLDDTIEDQVPYDAAIVLAGFADTGWYLARRDNPTILPNYHRLGSNADRLVAATELALQNRVQRILLGDDRNHSFSEAELARAFLANQGVSPERLVVYGGVINTRDEARRLKDWVAENAPRRLLLITSAMHMRRAAALFAKQGLHPHRLSVQRQSADLRANDFVPSGRGLNLTKGLLYELVGYLGYLALGDL